LHPIARRPLVWIRGVAIQIALPLLQPELHWYDSFWLFGAFLFMILFLDFDGVLHPDPCHRREQLFCQLPLLESVLRAVPSVEIVISSTWRLQYLLEQLQQLFSPDIGPRIIGVTPVLEVSDPLRHPPRYPRQIEIDAWLKQSNRSSEAWIALDDREEWFEPGLACLVCCDARTGLSEKVAKTLRRKLDKS
jgi:hypothetical protein